MMEDGNMIAIGKQLSAKLSLVSFVCMCMIVGIHVQASFEKGTVLWYLLAMIKSLLNIAVPMFFVISGFLLAGHFSECGWWRRETGKRIKSLLVPYVAWNCIYWAISYLPHACDFGFGRGDVLGLNPFAWSALPYLWYVRCLIVYVVCAPVFLLCCHRRLGLLFMAAECLGFACVLMLCKDQWNEINWIRGMCFFSLGVYMRWNGVWVMNAVRKVPCYFCWIVGGALSFVNIAYVSVFGLIGVAGACVLAVAVWKSIPAWRGPKWLTSSAFPIFVLHGAVLLGFAEMFRALGVWESVVSSIVAYFLQICGAVAVCLGICLILRRVTPRLSSVLFGGR